MPNYGISCPSKAILQPLLAENKIYLITVKEKHETWYRGVQSEQAFKRFFLKLLKDRFEDGNYYIDPNSPDEKPKEPSLTQEQANALTDGIIKTTAIQEWGNYKFAIERHKQDIKEWNLINKALEEMDGWLAYIVIGSRSLRGCEYEEISVDLLEMYEGEHED